uniref:Delta-conotoxin-like CnVID n=1 Tax=Conus consors TaxID=101297 RepID=O16D_CONCN|nr:RecName: Full=Delta-conotoxin-like CnVID; Short=Delta-CnVID [Conus consors]
DECFSPGTFCGFKPGLCCSARCFSLFCISLEF